MALFHSRHVVLLSALLIVQGIGFHALPSGRDVPLRKPLDQLPGRLADWAMVRETPLDPEVNQVLRADTALNRDYVSEARHSAANLFVAYFQSQRNGQTPHSPQHCMPGAGWSPESLTAIPISIDGRSYQVNRYVLQKGGERNVVLYWYQSNGRVTASEYAAKIYLVADAIRFNRTEAALVRTVVRVPENGSVDRATETAIGFIRAFFQPLQECLP